ncbi:Non-heme chloroperoxidase [Symmachiella macrocystis]|uniref:Non-heme chloroperoxidase n=1 Tax=Symmachiella macrocystis TaxID=2527985 RepID=A0A5C6BNI2_9PLAN|nr:alpha/beta hydrolase [Symmachiella macrocystis]TWU13297.1 Non-heme chloroperoxidase [Symmachiella macrocystis]
MQKLILSDGRTLAYEDYGDPQGATVIFNHGLSDSRLIRNPDEALTRSLGVRVIAADQPGVGGSSPQKSRKMVDWGQDMEELADFLNLDRFAVAGHSGGSPHALAVAFRLKERVTKVVLASPVAPLDEPGMGKLMINKDLKLIAKLHHLHFLIKWASNFAAKNALKDIPSFVEATAHEDSSDAETFLRNPAQREMFEASFAAGLQQGGEGMYEMIMALWDWGFKPEEVQQRVELFYGDADDILDVKMPLHLAKQLPDCKTHVWDGAGHYGFVDDNRWSEFMNAAT